MPNQILEHTKFAAIHLTRCNRAEDLPERVILGPDLSAYTRAVVELTPFDEKRIGSENARDFRSANLVLMASCRSELPTFRDGEWKRLDQRVFALFYALLLHEVPRSWARILAAGGRNPGEDTFVGHISILPMYYAMPHVRRRVVDEALLRSAALTAEGISIVFDGKPGTFGRVRRGVNRLMKAWRSDSFLERIHCSVAALDGLMKLEQGRGEQGFRDRLRTFARGGNIENAALEMYRLRSLDEHLSDWPSKLRYVKEAHRDQFVAHRAFQAEVIAGAMYRAVLTDPRIRESFRTDEKLEHFWANGTPWPSHLDLDLEERRVQFTEE